MRGGATPAGSDSGSRALGRFRTGPSEVHESSLGRAVSSSSGDTDSRAPISVRGLLGRERLVTPLRPPALIPRLSSVARRAHRQLHQPIGAARQLETAGWAPTAAAVKQLASAWTKERKDVLEVLARAALSPRPCGVSDLRHVRSNPPIDSPVLLQLRP
jgi:hypothetical protein